MIIDDTLTDKWLSANCDIREGSSYVFSVTSSCKWPTTLEIGRTHSTWLAMLVQCPAIDDDPPIPACIAVGHPQTKSDVMLLVAALRGKNDRAWRHPDER